MAKFYDENENIYSGDRFMDELKRKGEFYSESSDKKSWSKTFIGTEFNSDGTPNMDKVSDGYHTFGELYEHRTILFAYLCRLAAGAWWSEKHDDGTMFDGMFIAGISFDDKYSIEYHIDNKFKHLFDGYVRYREKAPKWDGKSPSDEICELERYLESWVKIPKYNNKDNTYI